MCRIDAVRYDRKRTLVSHRTDKAFQISGRSDGKIGFRKYTLEKRVEYADPFLQILYRVSVVRANDVRSLREQHLEKKRRERRITCHHRTHGIIGLPAMKYRGVCERPEWIQILVERERKFLQVGHRRMRLRKADAENINVADTLELRQCAIEPECD